MKTGLFIIAAALVVPACRPAPEAPAVRVDNPVVTLPAVRGRAGAGYFTLRSELGPIRLVGIESSRAERIELHETRTVGGASHMRPLAQVLASPGEPLVFSPGGRHAMLFGLDPALEPGDRLRLVFRFDIAPPIEVDAEVRAPGDAGHGAH